MYPKLLEAFHALKVAVEGKCADVDQKKVTLGHALAEALSDFHPVINRISATILDDCFPRDRLPNVDLIRLEEVVDALCHKRGDILLRYAENELCADLGL